MIAKLRMKIVRRNKEAQLVYWASVEIEKGGKIGNRYRSLYQISFDVFDPLPICVTGNGAGQKRSKVLRCA